MCLLTNENYKSYRTGFSFSGLGHAPGDWGVGGQKLNVSEIQPNLMCELLLQRYNFFGPRPLDLGETPNGQISLNSNYKVNFKDFFNLKLCVVSQMKDINSVRPDFHSVAWVMPQGWDLGCW